jgi:hypothetical protein
MRIYIIHSNNVYITWKVFDLNRMRMSAEAILAKRLSGFLVVQIIFPLKNDHWGSLKELFQITYTRSPLLKDTISNGSPEGTPQTILLISTIFKERRSYSHCNVCSAQQGWKFFFLSGNMGQRLEIFLGWFSYARASQWLSVNNCYIPRLWVMVN